MTSPQKQDVESKKLLKKLQKQKLSKKEIDARLKQSLSDRIAALHEQRGGPTPTGRNPFRTLEKRANTPYQTQVNDYLNSLAHPEMHMSMIPDNTTFPRATAQIRTVASIYPSISTHVGGGGRGVFLFSPYLLGGEVLDGGYLIFDSTTYTTTFPVHNSSEWESLLSAYRVVSMSVKFEYIGTALTNSGTIACACWTPSMLSSVVPTSQEQIGEYNYSYQGAAANGAYQIWMPAGSDDFRLKDPNVDYGATTGDEVWPFIAVGFSGLPFGDADNKAVFTMTWTMNIEAFSTDQVLTATKNAGKPDPLKMSVALRAMSQAHAAKKTNGNSRSSGSVFNNILSGVKNVAKFGWDNRELIGGLVSMGASLI